jgi:hypothetical protein
MVCPIRGAACALSISGINLLGILILYRDLTSSVRVVDIKIRAQGRAGVRNKSR